MTDKEVADTKELNRSLYELEKQIPGIENWYKDTSAMPQKVYLLVWQDNIGGLSLQAFSTEANRDAAKQSSGGDDSRFKKVDLFIDGEEIFP